MVFYAWYEENDSESTKAQDSILNADFVMIPTLANVLEELKLKNLVENFKKEEVEIDDILAMNKDDIGKICKECGLVSFGQRFRFLNKIRHIKNEIANSAKITNATTENSELMEESNPEDLTTDQSTDKELPNKSSLNSKTTDVEIGYDDPVLKHIKPHKLPLKVRPDTRFFILTILFYYLDNFDAYVSHHSGQMEDSGMIPLRII